MLNYYLLLSFTFLLSSINSFTSLKLCSQLKIPIASILNQKLAQIRGGSTIDDEKQQAYEKIKINTEKNSESESNNNEGLESFQDEIQKIRKEMEAEAMLEFESLRNEMEALRNNKGRRKKKRDLIKSDADRRNEEEEKLDSKVEEIINMESNKDEDEEEELDEEADEAEKTKRERSDKFQGNINKDDLEKETSSEKQASSSPMEGESNKKIEKISQEMKEPSKKNSMASLEKIQTKKKLKKDSSGIKPEEMVKDVENMIDLDDSQEETVESRPLSKKQETLNEMKNRSSSMKGERFPTIPNDDSISRLKKKPKQKSKISMNPKKLEKSEFNQLLQEQDEDSIDTTRYSHKKVYLSLVITFTLYAGLSFLIELLVNRLFGTKI